MEDEVKMWNFRGRSHPLNRKSAEQIGDKIFVILVIPLHGCLKIQKIYMDLDGVTPLAFNFNVKSVMFP